MSHSRSPCFRMSILVSVPCLEARVEPPSVQRRLDETAADMTISPSRWLPLRLALGRGTAHRTRTRFPHHAVDFTCSFFKGIR